MKIIRQLGIIASILLISEAIKALFALPIPSNVLGMVILFVLLCTGVVKEDDIRETADFFYKNMAFFLIPPTCSILVNFGALKSGVWQFLLISAISTVAVFISTGYAVMLTQRVKNAILKGKKVPRI